MKILVFGLGYVGVVTAACLAQSGHSVVGVETSAAKVTSIQSGISPIIEEQLPGIVRSAVESGRLRAVTEASHHLIDADMAIVCVGTPSGPDGALDLGATRTVCGQIGHGIRHRTTPLLVVFRSTLLPGTMRNMVIPALETACGAPKGRLFRAVFHPEFLREGSSVDDYRNPPKIVIGSDDEADAHALMGLYPKPPSVPLILCTLEVAEMAKYADNLFHAVKITFANEIGRFCRGAGIDGHEVMSVVCQDTKLNLSAAYLKPGFAFGGSCLPKDLRAILAEARQRGLPLPLLQAILPSNRLEVDRALDAVLATAPHRVGLYGLAFKPGTDDLRESPFLELAERLLAEGMQLVCHDRHVRLAHVTGRNRAFLDGRLPDPASILAEDVSSLDACDLILLCHQPPDALRHHWNDRGIALLDLSGRHRIP